MQSRTAPALGQARETREVGSQTVTRNLFYKRAAYHDTSTDPQLADMIRLALRRGKKNGVRRESLSPAGEAPVYRVIGDVKSEREWIFGVLMRFAPGTSGQFVSDDPTAEVLTITKLKAGLDAQGRQLELLDSLLFFGVLGNHVVLLQGALRVGQLERHLQWLLYTLGALPHSNRLRLVDHVPRKFRELVKRHPVKTVTIGADLDSVPFPEPEGEPKELTAGAQLAAGQSNGVWQAILKLIPEDRSAKLDLDALTGSNLEYKLTLTYDRKTTKDGQKLLDGLAMALRETDDIDTVLTLKSGEKIKGDKLKISGPVRIPLYEGAPAPLEVFELMREWLLARVQDGATD